MLDDQERERLADIERELLKTDPLLLRRQVADEVERGPRAQVQGRHEWVFDLIIGVALLISAFAVLLGSPDRAAGFTTVTALAVFLRHRLPTAATRSR